MSTIHDALKKVQDNMRPEENLSENQSKPQPPRPHNPFNPPPKETPEAPVEQAPDPRFGNKKKLLAVMLILFILCGLGFVVTYAIDHVEISMIKQKLFPSKDSQATANKTLSQDNDSIFVQGVMMNGDKGAALINNEIYQIGDIIKGKKIKSISRSHIIMTDENGGEEILEVSK